MKRLLLAVLPAMALPAAAQVLRIEAGTTDPMELHFDPVFIGRNAIAEIVGTPMVKRENEPMREKQERHLYRFDPIGRTVYSNNSFGRPGSGRDTASVSYTYGTAGQATEELHNDLSGHYLLTRELDTAGRIVRETYSRVENLGADRYHLVPGARTEISDEHYVHATINDTASKVVFLNNAGLPYREQVRSRDRWGYLRAIEDHWLVTARTGRITFRYDEKGRLAERIERPDLSRPDLIRHEWRYDGAGNVLHCDLARGSGPVSHTEFVYEDGTMFLKAMVTKQLDTGLIHVIRFSTQRR